MIGSTSNLSSEGIGADDTELFFYEIAACAGNLPPRLPPTSWAGHIPFLYLLFKLQSPRLFVELGVQNGASFIAACDAARRARLSCRLVGIDTWLGDANTGYYEGVRMLEELSSYVGSQFPDAELVRSTFAEARRAIAPLSIDLLHIDGLHSYEAVREDFETWRDAISERGVILFHDTYIRERGFGVARFWNELKHSHRTIEFNHGYGLGVLFFGKELPRPLERFVQLLESNNEFAWLTRSLYEEMGNTLPQRLFDREQGGAYPAWTKFKTESLAEIAKLREENRAIKQQLENYEVLVSEIRRGR
jgi:hypothetical protein